MTASGGLYPALGKHFKNMTELAHAGNMNRDTMRKCLNGERQFTRAEKKAIKEKSIEEKEMFDKQKAILEKAGISRQ